MPAGRRPTPVRTVAETAPPMHARSADVGAGRIHDRSVVQVPPVLGVPVESKALKGMDSLLSIAQMPGGVPVGCMAIGKAGAINAALLAAAVLATSDDAAAAALEDFRARQTATVLENPDPRT